MFIGAQLHCAALFGPVMGMMASAVTLILHIIFGAVLGFTYDKLRI